MVLWGSTGIPLKYFFILSDSSYEQCNVSRTWKYIHVWTFYILCLPPLHGWIISLKELLGSTWTLPHSEPFNFNPFLIEMHRMCRDFKPKLFLPPCPPGGWSHHIRDSRLDPDWNVSPGFIECHEPPWWCTHQAITLQEWTQNIEALLLFIPKLSSFDPRSQLMGDFNTLSPLLPGITMCERL